MSTNMISGCHKIGYYNVQYCPTLNLSSYSPPLCGYISALACSHIHMHEDAHTMENNMGEHSLPFQISSRAVPRIFMGGFLFAKIWTPTGECL